MKSTFTALALAALLVGGAAFAQSTQIKPGGALSNPMPAEIVPPKTATADVLGPGAKKLGTATLTEGKQGVLIRLTLTAGALKAGWHGLHIHEKGDCSAAGFTSAGAHVGHSASVMHGLLNPRGPEPGDLPSLYAPAAGLISAEVFSPWSTLSANADGQRQPLLDADGSALVIHANVDDQQTQPIGGAGDRVACAVIKG